MKDGNGLILVAGGMRVGFLIGDCAGMLRPMSSAQPLYFRMAARLVVWLATATSWLPLRLLHAVGALVGRVIVTVDKGFRAQIEENLGYAELATPVQKVAAELGKGFLEITVAWCRSPEHIASQVVEVEGWEHVTALQGSGRGIIWVTPHLGSYDIGGRYISRRTPVLAMYRPPKMAWLEPLMNAGRERDTGAVARADVTGVRLMLKTLKDGGSIIVLPDQVPSGGDGVWAPFFGQLAYTMTLVPRLARSTGASVLMFYNERLPQGRGFKLHIFPLEGQFSNNKTQDATVLNRNVERLIRMCPEQYLWSYRRFKMPQGAGPRVIATDHEKDVSE